MNRTELKLAAKSQLSGNLFTLILMIIIMGVIGFACGFIPIVGFIVAFIIAGGLRIAYIRAHITLVHGGAISAGDLFNSMDMCGKSAWLLIQTTIFTFLWGLLLWIPGIIKSLSYSAAPYILALNPELTASEALAKSMVVMNGHKMELFLLSLSFIGWFILIPFTLGLAALYVVPYMNLTMANFYSRLLEE